MKAKEDGESMEEWNEVQRDGVGVQLPRVFRPEGKESSGPT